jgi:N-acetylglucosaminyldiphosphoundecaprenol N-acetyl-beta-D-mannosaminyltransferase
MLMQCKKEPKYADLLNRSSLSLPDGAGVLLAAKRNQTPLRERVAGIDFAKALLERAQDEHLRVFLLGGKEGVAAHAKERLLKIHPDLCICGCHHGYFQKSGKENQAVLDLIREAHPDILFVCFGFPIQEEWIAKNLSRLPSVRIAAGLGGTLDVFAGDIKRAPKIVSRLGMEWLWRMAREPKRFRHLPALINFYLRAPK